MSDTDFTRNSIQQQLTEIEILKSIYPNSNEFVIEDEGALFEAQLYVENEDSDFKLEQNLGFVIKFNAEISEENGKKQTSDDEENFIQVYKKKITGNF